MKYKYVMIGGVAFSEKMDMEKLSKYAKQGWILEGIKFGFFYKLRKDKPQDIIYSLDYQADANNEYMCIFEESGWKHMVSIENLIHIFSAKTGTKPIYSDHESELSKYITIRDKSKKGSLSCFILAIVLSIILLLSIFLARPIFLIVLAFLIVDTIALVFNFMPYLAYNNRIRAMQKGGEYNEDETVNRFNWKSDAILSISFLVLMVVNFDKHIFLSSIYLMAGIRFAFSGIRSYKKYKNSINH